MYVRYTQPKGLKAQFEIIHYGEGQIHMKCPICGQELRPGKKDPNYLLCYTCKKKFKVPQHQAEDVAPKTERMSAKKEAGRRDSAKKDSARKENVKKERSVKEQKYSNIPPKEVRDKREREMKKAYDDMLSVEEEKVSKAPIIILAIAIIVVAAVIVYMLLK